MPSRVGAMACSVASRGSLDAASKHRGQGPSIIEESAGNFVSIELICRPSRLSLGKNRAR